MLSLPSFRAARTGTPSRRSACDEGSRRAFVLPRRWFCGCRFAAESISLKPPEPIISARGTCRSGRFIGQVQDLCIAAIRDASVVVDSTGLIALRCQSKVRADRLQSAEPSRIVDRRVKVSAVTGPTPGTDISRRQTPVEILAPLCSPISRMVRTSRGGIGRASRKAGANEDMQPGVSENRHLRHFSEIIFQERVSVDQAGKSMRGISGG